MSSFSEESGYLSCLSEIKILMNPGRQVKSEDFELGVNCTVLLEPVRREEKHPLADARGSEHPVDLQMKVNPAGCARRSLT